MRPGGTARAIASAAVALVAIACGAGSERLSDFEQVAPRRDGGADAGTGGEGFTDPDGGALDELAACGKDVRRAKPAPLDLYVMLDASGSMAFSTGTGASKWSAVTTALEGFWRDPRSEGLGVGLQVFPILRRGVPDTCTSSSECNGHGPCATHACAVTGALKACDTPADCPGGEACVEVGTCGTGGAVCLVGQPNQPCGAPFCRPVTAGYCEGIFSCDEADYAAPLVPIAELPPARARLVNALAGRSPNGGTPTSGALAGAVAHARAWAADHPDHVTATLLVTDGLPSQCTVQDAAGLAAIARAARDATPSARTYVIGVFAADEAAAARPLLDAVAEGGGTSGALILDTSTDVASALLDALNRIRLAALPCDYAVPVPTSGDADYGKVNVRMTADGTTPRTVPFTGSSAACDPSVGGWHYDADPPTRIVLCPSTCAALKSDPRLELTVVLGCTTVLK